MRTPFLLRFLLVFAAAGTLSADPIPITGYDIINAVLSGHGNWSHTYDGTITPGDPFVNNTWPGTTALYSGVGSGTLNDGIIGGSVGNTQLFVTPAPTSDPDFLIGPEITLTLSFAYTIDTIEIYGGNITNNDVPGAITGVTVGLLDHNFVYHEEVFSTVAFGTVFSGLGVPVNDRISLIGSSLEGIPAYAVTLYDFQGNVANWISITEITLDGQRYTDGSPIPEPATLGLVALALAGLTWRRRASAQGRR